MMLDLSKTRDILHHLQTIVMLLVFQPISAVVGFAFNMLDKRKMISPIMFRSRAS